VLVAVDRIEVPGFEDTRLQPGSAQLLLTGLTRPLEVGDTVPLTLEFERAGESSVDATVETYDQVAEQLIGPRLRIPGQDVPASTAAP
jgi:hypothetical protein